MLKTLIVIAAVLAVAVIGLLVYAATRPNTFRIQRAMTINAPVDRIHAILTDLRRGAEWSPFERLDPNIRRTFTGPETGVGSALSWEGNNAVGAGTLTITDATPEKIMLKLDMRRPMEGHNIVEYTLTPQGEATTVTWIMHGPMNLIAKVFHLFMNIEKDLGGAFELGLRDLKGIAEKSA